MGVSRRMFTREMKTAAVRRLENGSSAAEVARAFEVNPNTRTDGRRNSAKAQGMPFLGQAYGAGMKLRSPNWNVRLASRPWRSIF
jgi:transposase-like protein